jgi:4-amino-4-deoxy-L-arabinose transferase-like glycosyltransferase
LILACIFLLALELQDWKGWQGWALFGALYGIGALANPTTLAFLPFCGLWVWRQRHRRGLSSLGGVVVASIFFWVALSPWLVRNYAVFGRLVFIRDDFGLQFRLGNWKGADGMLMAYLQPNLDREELERFQSMGERDYAELCKREAFEWIRENPGRFAVISLKRVFYYWNGVPRETNSVSPLDFRTSGFLATSVLALWGLGRAIRQKRPGAWLFAGLVLTYPTVYYFVFPHARYRHPIEPELTVLIVFLIYQAVGRQKEEVK